MTIKTLVAAAAISLFAIVAGSPAIACDVGYTDYCYGSSYDESAWRWE